MLSVKFLLRVLTAPWVIIKIIIQYYTTGTALQAEPREFGNSLWKNIDIAVLSHIAKGITRKDPWIVTHPMNPYYKSYARLAGGQGMPSFGKQITPKDKRLTWVVKPEGAKHALLFFHGGGYCVPMTKSQFVGIMALWYAVEPEKRQNLAIANLDYLLTCYDHRYPTQIFEAVSAYRELTKQGYEVLLIGDSAGANLALALSRFAAYPEEARAQFSRYKQFDWDFLPLPAPKHLLLVAPWIEPYTKPEKYPGVDYEGDLGSPEPDMGIDYLGKASPNDVAPFVDFFNTSYQKHWSKVPAFNGEGSVIFLYGEREIFRVAQEDFIKRNGKLNFYAHMQSGAVHDSMFYIEPSEFRSLRGQRTMVTGKHRSKFSFKLSAEFLEEFL